MQDVLPRRMNPSNGPVGGAWNPGEKCQGEVLEKGPRKEGSHQWVGRLAGVGARGIQREGPRGTHH